MTIAVTGATGQLGALVIESLLTSEPADSIVAIVRDPDKAGALRDAGVSLRVADYSDQESLTSALSGVDTVLLVSSSEIGQRFPQHKNVIDAAITAGVGRLVYTSAPRATTSELILAPEHKATEEYLASTPLTHTILRNGWYTENYLPQLQSAAERGVIVAAAGAGRVASATRAELAEAAAIVLLSDGHDGKIYELSGDEAWNYDELAAAASEILGRPVSYQSVDVPTLAGILTEAGLDEPTAGFVAALEGDTAKGLLSERTGELSALLGRPTLSLREGLERAWSASRNQ